MAHQQHDWAALSMVPIDVRLEQRGEEQVLSLTAAPDRQEDHDPAHICRVCYMPLDLDSFGTPCEGARVPDDISTLGMDMTDIVDTFGQDEDDKEI